MARSFPNSVQHKSEGHTNKSDSLKELERRIVGNHVVVTLWTSDLLEGMIVGTATKIVLLVKDVVRVFPGIRVGAALKELFGNFVIRLGNSRSAREVMTVAATAVRRGTVGEMKNPFKICLASATCMNLVKLDAALKKIVVPDGREDRGPHDHGIFGQFPGSRHSRRAHLCPRGDGAFPWAFGPRDGLA